MANRFPRAASRISALAAGLSFCAFPAFAAEDYSQWTNVTNLTLNTSPAGANIPVTITGFPMLVRLTAANFAFAEAQPDGGDIRFSKADGTPLDYEIERWDAAKQAAEVWVKVDSVKGNSATHFVRMHWGNAAAADSSDGPAVFSNGYTSVWHLGGAGTGARPNSAPGGLPAATANYDGDENSAGVIGGADSLDGAAAGDYLDLGDGYANFTGGLTYTIWVYPTAVKQWCHVLDLGNGEGIDNIILNRVDTTNNLGWHNWTGTTSTAVTANGQWALNTWQMLGVTVSGKYVKLYKNGALVLNDSVGGPIANVTRTMNFIGRSNWARDQYYQGKVDQAELSRVAHSEPWMRLLYQNQKPGQAIPIVTKADNCARRFAAPADTSIPEGGRIVLNASIECASSFAWSVVSGPAAKILDPEVKSLEVAAPRVPGDTDLVFRLSATFSDSTRTRDVRVRVLEAIPDPAFTLPPNAAWNGKDSLAIRPVIANLAAIKASRDSAINWNWSFTGPEAEKEMIPDGVLLRSCPYGELGIKLCLDNGGKPLCREMAVTVSSTSGLAARPPKAFAPSRRERDALGRKPPGFAPVPLFAPLR